MRYCLLCIHNVSPAVACSHRIFRLSFHAHHRTLDDYWAYVSVTGDLRYSSPEDVWRMLFPHGISLSSASQCRQLGECHNSFRHAS